MRGKLIFFTGLAVGFVLGARAGRERYDQIVAAKRAFFASRPVQAVTDSVSAFAGRRVDDVKGQIVASAANVVAGVIGYDKPITVQPKPKSASSSKRTPAGRVAAKRSSTTNTDGDA